MDPSLDPVDLTCGTVVLRPWNAYDEDALVSGRNDPEVLRWTGSPSPYTAEDARAFLTEEVPQGWADGTAANWGVYAATTGEVVGGASVHRIRGGDAAVSYWLVPQARGAGLASEVLAAVCRWAFGALGLVRLEWACCVGNFASRAVAQKVGFTVEGLARQAFDQRGTRVDDWTGALLATDPMTDTRPLPRPPVLTDGVVTLRGWTLDDAPACARACDDPLTAQWLPVPRPYALADAEGYIGGFIATSWAEGTAAELAVTDAQTGELLGAVGLKLHQRAQGVGEVGYWTAPWARGRGVAGRGAALSARWGLEVLGLDRVELLADVENLRSQRAAERGGFVREGVLRQARHDRDGVAHDMAVFSLVRADLAGG